MTYEFSGDFRDVKPSIVVCSLCHLMAELYTEPNGMSSENKLVWRAHLRRKHGWTEEIGA